MESLFNINGLMFWTDREIRLRDRFVDHYAVEMQIALRSENKAWEMVRFEGPELTPREIINPNYTNNDVWVQQDEEEQWVHADLGDSANTETYRLDGDLVLRPETTPSSYVYAEHLLNNHSGHQAPLCVWQVGKSFRREQDQVTKNMRLKEFYQQEFQCIYSSDTMNDYHSKILEPVRKMIGETVNLPTRLVDSDRLPSYSEITTDVEVNNGDKWMEVCSISRRTDFHGTLKFQAKKKLVEKQAFVLEVAIGLDRCLFCHDIWRANLC